MKSTAQKLCPCPACMAPLDYATHADKSAPEPGSFSVCVYCTAILQFQDDMTLRLLPDETLATLPPEVRQHLQTLQKAWRAQNLQTKYRVGARQ